MRDALFEHQRVTLISEANARRTRTFTIKKVLGSGSSCIAYRATDEDSKLPVVVKECFPYNAAVREKNGTITWNTADDEARAKERFCTAFEMQRQIQSADETMNTSVHLIDSLYFGCNTLYTVSDIQNTQTYDLVPDSSLQQVLTTARSIARVIGRYHARGLLHLDIKPQNILIDPDTRDKVLLLDFDSVVHKSDTIRPGMSISYTHEYAAPELLQGKRNKLCGATDIYSVGAVMFSRIMGRTPTADDRGTFSDWDFTDHPFFKRLSNKAHRLTKELLKKSLSASIRARYQSATELIAALDDLIEESDPKRRHLNSTYTHSRNYFTGRAVELSQIHTTFSSGKRAVFINGMGGIGKTELALRYAEQYKSEYDVIAFGRFNDSLDGLFKSSDFISIENDAEGMPTLDTIRGLVDERTLLIIDNFDAEADSRLDAVLSLKCNLMFTSRYSFEEVYGNDSAIAHISIGELSVQEQSALFERECGQMLNDDERGIVQLILKEISGYTLLIPLIAKTFKKGDYTISEMQQRIYDARVRIHHHKDSVLSDSTYAILCEVLNMAGLSEEETHVVRSLALLGGIVIERKEFDAWLGGKYLNVINELADKNWVQRQGLGVNAKVSLHKVIAEVAQSVLKPDFGNCEWAYSLCLAESLKLGISEEHKQLEYWQIPKECKRNSDHTTPIIEAVVREKKAKLLITILNSVDFSISGNLLAAIEILSSVILDIRFIDDCFSIDISIINDEMLVEPLLSLLCSIVSAQHFSEVSGKLRYDAHRMQSTMYTAKRLNGFTAYEGHPQYETQGTPALINKATESLIAAEKALESIENISRLEKDELLLRLAMPVVTYALHSGVLEFLHLYGYDDASWIASDSFFKQIFAILNKTKSFDEHTLAFGKENSNYCSDGIFPFSDEFYSRRDEYIKEAKIWGNMERYGYHSDGYSEEDYKKDRSYSAWLDGAFFLSELETRQEDEYLEELMVDKHTRKEDKAELLLLEVSHLGFEPYHISNNDNWVQICIKNKGVARKYMNYIAPLIDELLTENESNYFSIFAFKRYYKQAILLAWCEDNKNENSIDFLMSKFCSHAEIYINDDDDEMTICDCACDVFDNLIELGFEFSAKKLIGRIIIVMEAVIQNCCKTDDRYCSRLNALISLVNCTGDLHSIQRYTHECIGVLDLQLQSDSISKEQRYDIIDSLIKHAERINDETVIVHYSKLRILSLESELHSCDINDQRYNLLESLICHAERINDVEKIKRYKAELKRLLGLGFEI